MFQHFGCFVARLALQSFLIHHHVQGSLAIVARWARNDYKNPKELIVNAMSIADQAAEEFIMKE